MKSMRWYTSLLLNPTIKRNKLCDLNHCLLVNINASDTKSFWIITKIYSCENCLLDNYNTHRNYKLYIHWGSKLFCFHLEGNKHSFFFFLTRGSHNCLNMKPGKAALQWKLTNWKFCFYRQDEASLFGGVRRFPHALDNQTTCT